MKTGKIISICFLLCCASIHAQQNVTYSQYMLNGMGLNPAYAGESGPLEIIMGRRTQWVGFPGGPVANFAGVCKGFRKKGFYRSWHGIGAYVEADNAGLFTMKNFSVIYAWHKRLAHGYTISAGVSIGAAIYSFDGLVSDPSDPALRLYPPEVFIFPIINPGIRLSSRKMYFDFSIKQATANETVSVGGTKEIGTSNRLIPSFYFTFGRNFTSANYAWTYTPSIQLRSTLTFYPIADLNFLIYYHKTIGIGVSYRNLDSFVAMLQFRLKNKIILGLSYDYSVSRFSNANANSREIIFGFTPYGVPNAPLGANRIAQCPGFDR
jgi:type IX secretion system PorP/SprF family membrane protein